MAGSEIDSSLDLSDVSLTSILGDMPDEIGDDMSKKCDGDGCEKCAKKGADIESLKKKIRKIQELYSALCVRFEELQANYDNLAKAST